MQSVAAPSLDGSGTWSQITIATPAGTFTWPPEPKGWGNVRVKVESAAAKDNQKAAGRAKTKTKKSGPEPLKVTISMTWIRSVWSDPRGPQALLNAVDPNNDSGKSGPFDFQAADFNRRGGKSIDIDNVGEVEWRGNIGTCTITAKEWVPEPPKEKTQGTKTPDKSTELVPGTEDVFATPKVHVLRSGIAGIAATLSVQVTQKQAEQIAKRGFDGDETPTAAP